MRAKIRQILEECIETGIESGYLRAHEYNDNPYGFHIYEQIENAIWLEIDQRFVFDNEPDEDHYPRGVCTEVAEGLGEIEAMRRKCIVKDCQNHAHQGEFTGDLCNPCYAFITDGTGVYSQAYRNSKREWVGLTQEELQDLCVKSYHTDNAGETHFNRGYFADAIEAKLKEKNT